MREFEKNFREAMRSKLLYTILAFACVLILSSWAVGQMSLHQEARVARDMGLGGIFFFGVVLSIVGVHLLLVPLLWFGVYLIAKPGVQGQFVNQVRSDALLFGNLIASRLATGGSQQTADLLGESPTAVFEQCEDK